ncbi:hypothetical protein TNCV_3274831 [Trichonephila clavipes]|uniref:Uncharacterized protein n=1 Tax=Trichonephila clavipes TaxID=2585209 RepID=A0A8X6SIL7_TRICX|nr:hypothetical protein TNCV_3274831 [Trichonephila clavipes]
MPLSRQKNPTLVKPNIKVLSRHGIEDCFTFRMPKGKRLFNSTTLERSVVSSRGLALDESVFNKVLCLEGSVQVNDRSPDQNTKSLSVSAGFD